MTSSSSSGRINIVPSAAAEPVRFVHELNDIPPKPWWLILCFTSWMGSYAFVFNSLSSIVLPQEIRDIRPDKSSETVGLVSGFGAIFQLSGLVMMFFSDRSHSPFGRRRPFLVIGSGLAIVGCILLFLGVYLSDLTLIIMGYYVIITGLSIGSSIVSALIPDLTPGPQHGMSSGIMALHGIIGSAVGYLLMVFSVDVGIVAWCYTASILIFTLVTIFTAREVPWNPTTLKSTSLLEVDPATHLLRPEPDDRPSISFVLKASFFTCCRSSKQFLSSYFFSPRRHPDFILTCFMRVFYYMSVAALTYVQYWLADVIGSEQASSDMGKVALVTLMAALVVSVPSGKLSDVIGRKIPIIIAFLFIMSVFISWIFVRTFTAVLLTAIIYGFGNGLYSTMEYAIACDTLPSKKANGKYMAEFSVALTLGMLLGQTIDGMVLERFPVPDQEGAYTEEGYMVLFILSISFLVMSLICAAIISHTRGKAAQVDEEKREADAELRRTLRANGQDFESALGFGEISDTDL